MTTPRLSMSGTGVTWRFLIHFAYAHPPSYPYHHIVPATKLCILKEENIATCIIYILEDTIWIINSVPADADRHCIL